MKSFKILGASLVLVGCGATQIRTSIPRKPNPEIENLKKQVLDLSGTIAMINNFTATDFATCGGTELTTLEKKICKIAQSANAEQMLIYTGQLRSWNTVLTEALYGEDCFESTDSGCPTVTSILGRTTKLESDLAIANGKIETLQTDVGTLKTDVGTIKLNVTALEGRLNTVETSIATINTVISGIQTNIAGLQSTVAGINTRITGVEGRVDTLETKVTDGLNPANFLNTYEICKGVSGVTRPESVLIAGDWSKMISYVKVTTTQEGLATISATDSSWFTTTNLSPNKCNFKVYTFGTGTGLNVCWNSTNRSATEANINTICNNGRLPYGNATQCKCLRDF